MTEKKIHLEKEPVGTVLKRMWNRFINKAAAEKTDSDNLVEKGNSNTKAYLEQVERETNMTYPSRDPLDKLKERE